MKSHTFDHILSLREEEIAERYPYGARILPSKRWEPAEKNVSGMGHRTLGELIAEKRRRLIPERYLGKKHGYVDHPSRGLHQEFAAVDEATQERFSAEARAKDAAEELTLSLARLEGERQALRAQLEAYRRVAQERGVNIRSDLRVVERKLEELDRRLGLRRAA